jgi:hypothetical protein
MITKNPWRVVMPRKKGPEFPLHLDRNHLPEPEWEFKNAKIETYATDSKPDFPPTKTAPPGAPNILLILLDDVGFGWSSACGGLVRMPTAESVAAKGLFYNQFHTTALCSPTRAAMLTGRNHHSVATGVIQEMATGYPRLLRHHSQELRYFRRASEASRLHLRLVRQEPQRAG